MKKVKLLENTLELKVKVKMEVYKDYVIIFDDIIEYWGVKEGKYTYIHKDIETVKVIIDQLIREKYN